jgi:GDPmannose 4,6-dehydratase
VDLAFSQAGLDYRNHVVTDPTLFRPAEVNLLLGDATKAHVKLGWAPSVTFESLVREMVDADCRALGVAHESLRGK